ncbi:MULTISPECIES: hypothetical protein [unclassified Paraburkholderia]|uniref:hypothetical protein n=1 Tax=unclassified Paraburkholderia TaxID=2615204 RepID=UPI002AAFA184|nr:MULTISPECIES: hypothetical protein [unclassified Paraburkholderia]
MNNQTIETSAQITIEAAPRWTPAAGPMTNAQYTAFRGVRCPSCGSSDVSGGFVNIEEGSASQTLCCGECGAEWTDTYTLTGYANLEGGIDHVAVNSVVEDIQRRSKKFECSVDSEDQARELVIESSDALGIVLGEADTALAISKLCR